MAGLFETMAAGLPALQTKSVDAAALTWAALMGHATSKAGVAVNLDSSLKVSAVLACARVISEGMAQLPCTVGHYDPVTDSVTPARDDPYYRLLNEAPNDWMTSFEFIETLMFHAALTGNGLAVKNVLRGQIRELLPVPWNLVQVQRAPSYGLIYHVNDPYGLVGTFLPKDVVHLRGPSWDSVLGMDAVRLAREAIGLAIATEENHAHLFANGARPGGLLSIDGGLSPEARERIVEAGKNFGRDQAFKMMVLDKGADFKPFAMNGVDSQHLETRRFQTEEICRHFRVFPHMVGYSDKTATFASAESFFQGHVNYTLLPWVRRLKQVLKRDVLGRGDLVADFDVRELIRGDTAARASFYSSGITNGWLTRNDARRFEGLPPLPGLDEPLVPLNMGLPKDESLGDATAGQFAKLARLAVTQEVKSWLDSNGGLPTTETGCAELASRINVKLGRVLSAVNEGRIRAAHDSLADVLGNL